MQLAVCTIGPFVGPRYVVQCPLCSIANSKSYADGDALRARALSKNCGMGHVLRVRIDRTPCAFRRFVFAGSDFTAAHKAEAQPCELEAQPCELEAQPCELEPTRPPFAPLSF
jgi:hypothetical protein